jgi:hypothetical protein
MRDVLHADTTPSTDLDFETLRTKGIGGRE